MLRGKFLDDDDDDGYDVKKCNPIDVDGPEPEVLHLNNRADTWLFSRERVCVCCYKEPGPVSAMPNEAPVCASICLIRSHCAWQNERGDLATIVSIGTVAVLKPDMPVGFAGLGASSPRSALTEFHGGERPIGSSLRSFLVPLACAPPRQT